MKFAAYTNDSIWAVGATADEARAEGEATMIDLEASEEEREEMAVAPISAELEAALAAAESGGTEVMFDLVNGTLVVDHDEDGQQVA
jgi:hypothetical protein